MTKVSENAPAMEVIDTTSDTLMDIQRKVHVVALSKGWYDQNEPQPAERLLLMVTEVAEAYEELRNGVPLTEIYFRNKNTGQTLHGGTPNDFEAGEWKPEGVPVELADTIVRILDFSGRHGLDMARALRLKHAYNMTRPYRHGNKTA